MGKRRSGQKGEMKIVIEAEQIETLGKITIFEEGKWKRRKVKKKRENKKKRNKAADKGRQRGVWNSEGGI